MSQTGYTPIQLYYSTTASNTPSVANLSLGELGINLADQKAYMLNSAGTAVVTLVGTLGNQNANSVSITGGSVNGTTIGATTASTGAFTTLSATGVITSTVATGTAPFTIASTTQVANLNAATAGTATNATNTAITDNTSSSATWYPTIVSATTGNLPQTTSSTKLSFVPSTGTLTATSYGGAWAGSTIGTTYGGTGQTSFTANGVMYASSTSALATGSSFVFDGTNVGIGTNSPSTFGKLSVKDGTINIVSDSVSKRISFWSQGNGNSENAYIQSTNDGGTTNTGEIIFATKNVAATLAECARFTAQGLFKCAGVYNNTVGATNRAVFVDNTGVVGYIASIKKAKINIQDLTDTNWLYDLNPVTFYYRKKDKDNEYTDETDGNIQYGMIAEDVEKVRPDLCVYDEIDGKQELRGIEYSKLIPILLKEIQNLKQEFDLYKTTHL